MKKSQNPFSCRRRSSVPIQLVKDYVAHLNGLWEGTRLEATGSSVTLWIGTNLDCVLKPESLIVKVRGDGSMILEESDRREFSVKGEIDLSSMKVTMTRVVLSNSTTTSKDNEEEEEYNEDEIDDVVTYEGTLHNPWDDDDEEEEDDEVLPTCMSLHDRTGAELSLELVAPNAPLPELKEEDKKKSIPGMKTKPLKTKTSTLNSSYGDFNFRDTKDCDDNEEEVKKQDDELESKEQTSIHKRPDHVPSTPSSSNTTTPKTPSSNKEIAAILLQREREYVNAARTLCKETGSTETTQRYLEAASMLSTARMLLIQDEEKGAMFDPKRLDEVRKLVREGKVKEEVLVRLEEVSKANRPDAFRWDLMPPSLVSTNRTNKMFDTNEDVSMTNMLRSTVSKRREDLETGTSSRRKSSVLFEEQVSLSEGLRRRTPMSSKDKIRRRTVIDTYRPPSFTTARAYWQERMPHDAKLIDVGYDVETEISRAENDTPRRHRSSAFVHQNHTLAKMIAYMYHMIGKMGGQNAVTFSEIKTELLQEFGWHEVQLHEAELQKALLRVNSTAKHRCCGSRTGRFCRSREACGIKIDLGHVDPFHEGVNSEFESYGFCVVAHFKLLKFVGWLFLILQLVYLPQCVMNATKGSTNIALTSLSNLVDIRGISDNSTMNGTIAVMYPSFEGFEEPEDLLWIYVDITFAGAIMMFLCSLWLTHSLDKEAKTISKRILTVADFSLLFTGLPEENMTPKELGRFLSNHGLDIFDLRIARADGALIDLFKNRSKIVNDLEIAHQRVLRSLQERQSPWYVNSAIRNRNRCIEKLRDHDRVVTKCLEPSTNTTTSALSGSSLDGVEMSSHVRNISSSSSVHVPFTKDDLKNADMTVAAYVTFENVRSRRRAKELFRKRRRCCGCFSSYSKKLRGTHTLQAKVPPPPSTILWENLQYTYGKCLCRHKRYQAKTLCGRLKEDRFVRRLVSFLIGITLLGIAFTAGVLFRYEENRAAADWLGEDCTEAEKLTVPPECDLDSSSSLPSSNDTQHALKCYCSENLLNAYGCCTKELGSSVWIYIFGYPLVLALMIVGTNEVTRLVLASLEFLDRHLSLNSGAVSTSKRLFYLQFLTSAVMLLLLPGPGEDVFFLDLKTWSRRVFSPAWYLDVSTSILLYVLLFVISPWVFDFGLMVLDRCTRSGRLRKAVTQSELNETGLGGIFYVEYRTSMLMCLLFITLFFAPAEPMVFILASLACFVWYWVDKYLFVSYFRIPPRYSEEIPKVFGQGFRDAIVLHLIGAIFVFSDETIFPKSDRTIDGGRMVIYTEQDQYPPDTLTYRLIFNPNPNNDWLYPGLFRNEVVPLLWLVMILIVQRITDKVFGVGCMWNLIRRMCMCICSCCCGSYNNNNKKKNSIESRLNMVELEEDNSFFRGSSSSSVDNGDFTRSTETTSSSHEENSSTEMMLTERTTFWGMVARDKIDGLYTYHIFDNPRYRDYFRIASRDETLTDAVVKILTTEYPGGNYRYRYLRDSESMCVHPEGVHVNWLLYFACPPCCSVLKPRCCRKPYDKKVLRRWDSTADMKKLKKVVVQQEEEEEEEKEEEIEVSQIRTGDSEEMPSNDSRGIVLSGEESEEEKKEEDGADHSTTSTSIAADFHA